MKKTISILFLSSLLCFVSCSQNKSQSSSFISSETSTEKDSFSSNTKQDSSEQSSSSTSEYQNVITYIQCLNLINNAPYKDVDKIISSETTLDIYGQENGQRYHQQQYLKENTYSNDITIGKGNVSHYFVNDEKNVYETDFTTLRVLKDDFYYDITMYENDAFKSTTDALNLNLTSNLQEAKKEARCYVSSGIGVEAYEDFHLGYDMGANLAFASEYIEDDIHLIAYMNYESSSTNQFYIATFDYIFDINDMQIKKYVAEQAYYSYLAYQKNNYSIENLTPIDYVKQETQVTVGNLQVYDSELPYDIDSLFVQEIILEASKNEIYVGEELALKTTVLPETAIEKSLIFESENKTIARVDSKGHITGLNPGTCTIIATNLYSGTQGTFLLTVKEKEKPDPGDDSKKQDLQEALQLIPNQIFQKADYVLENNSLEYSSTGMIIDGDSNLNNEELMKLTISDFVYDENLRKATYVLDFNNLYNIIPFYDNGIENLSNRYLIKNSTSIYLETIVSFEIILKATNEIDYIKVIARTDSISTSNPIDKATINDENVYSLGELSINEYTKNIYYEAL